MTTWRIILDTDLSARMNKNYSSICCGLILAASLFAFRPVQAGGVEALPQPAQFDIARFQIDGNTLIDPASLDLLLTPYTGRQRSFADVQLALEALQQAYYKAGYGAVQVRLPEQEMVNGTVLFHVIEGKIRKVEVEGNEHHDVANILNPLPLAAGVSPRADRIESVLKVINENPSKKAQVYLKSGLVLGEVDARVKVVDEKPWKAGVILDNTGSQKTGELRLGVFFQQSNMWDRDHNLTLQYTTSPGHVSEVRVFGAGYHVPVYSLGDSFDVYLGYSDVDSGTVSNLFTVSGSGSVAGARYNFNLARHDNYDHKLIFGFEQRIYRNNVDLGGASLVPDIKVKPLSLTYAGNWKNLTQEVSFYVTEAANIKGGEHASDADFNASRAGADADYMVTRAGIDWIQTLDRDWRLHANFSGQYSHQALVAGEQFGLGGASSVRGFHERELADDRGYRISGEVYSPDFGKRIGDLVSARALVFYDYGNLHRNKTLPGETNNASLASLGAGVRVGVGERFSMQADLARVLDAGGKQDAGDYRGHVSMMLTY